MNSIKNIQNAAIIIGIVLVILFIVNRINPVKVDSIDQLLNGKIFNFFIYLAIRILSTILCINISKSLNRNIGLWGIFGFIWPPVALISLGAMSPKNNELDNKFEIEPVMKTNQNQLEYRSNHKNSTTLIVFGLLIVSIIVFSILSFGNINKNNQTSANSTSDNVLNTNKEYNKNKLYFTYPNNWKINEEVQLENFKGFYIVLSNIGINEEAILYITQINKDLDPESALNSNQTSYKSTTDMQNMEFLATESYQFNGEKAYKSRMSCFIGGEKYTGVISSVSFDHRNLSIFYLAKTLKESTYQKDYELIVNSLKPTLKDILIDNELSQNSFSKVIKGIGYSLLCPINWNKMKLKPGELMFYTSRDENIGGVIMLFKSNSSNLDIIYSEESYLQNLKSRFDGEILESRFYNYKGYFVAYTKSRLNDNGKKTISQHFTYFKGPVQYVFNISTYEDYYNKNKFDIDKIAYSLRLL